jgi:hypothetical protein
MVKFRVFSFFLNFCNSTTHHKGAGGNSCTLHQTMSHGSRMRFIRGLVDRKFQMASISSQNCYVGDVIYDRYKNQLLTDSCSVKYSLISDDRSRGKLLPLHASSHFRVLKNSPRKAQFVLSAGGREQSPVYLDKYVYMLRLLLSEPITLQGQRVKVNIMLHQSVSVCRFVLL